jgi:hypothetical protein
MGRVLGAIVVGLASFACGPWGPQGIFAGGRFAAGSAVAFPADWSFTDAHPLAAIETRGPYFRHSVTILCVSSGGKLYVMARHAPRKRWVRNVVRDPRVRVEVDGRVYAGRAVRLDDDPEAAQEGRAVARAFLRKYVALDAPAATPLTGPPTDGDDRAEIWTWRIDPPGDGS